MRISDWSTDVCSSDLLEHQHQRVFVGLADPGQAVETNVAGAKQIDPHPAIPRALQDPFADPFGQVVAVLDVDLWRHGGGQIGRTSCRVRVWHYGYVHVVDVVFRKKTT